MLQRIIISKASLQVQCRRRLFGESWNDRSDSRQRFQRGIGREKGDLVFPEEKVI